MNWSREAMFQKMKNKLFLKALPDSSPDAVSPRPPAGSQIRSKYTHEHAQRGHSVLEIGWRFLKKTEEVAIFFYPKAWGVSPGGFSLQNRFFSCWLRHSRSSRVGAREGKEGRKLRSSISRRRSFHSQ